MPTPGSGHVRERGFDPEKEPVGQSQTEKRAALPSAVNQPGAGRRDDDVCQAECANGSTGDRVRPGAALDDEEQGEGDRGERQSARERWKEGAPGTGEP